MRARFPSNEELENILRKGDVIEFDIRVRDRTAENAILDAKDRNENNKNWNQGIPLDILRKILILMEADDVLNLMESDAKAAYAILFDPFFWANKLQHEFPYIKYVKEEEEEEGKKSYANLAHFYNAENEIELKKTISAKHYFVWRLFLSHHSAYILNHYRLYKCIDKKYNLKSQHNFYSNKKMKLMHAVTYNGVYECKKEVSLEKAVQFLDKEDWNDFLKAFMDNKSKNCKDEFNYMIDYMFHSLYNACDGKKRHWSNMKFRIDHQDYSILQLLQQGYVFKKDRRPRTFLL